MNTGRGLEAHLDSLHGLLTDALRTELEQAMVLSKGPDGIPINPQLLDKVMKFLTMNGVTAPKASPRVDALAAQLHDLDLDALALERHQH